MVCDFAKPVLGIATNDQLIVTDINPYATADVQENVQIGDKLLTARPAVTVPGLSPEPIPFTNRDIANTLIGHFITQPTCYTSGRILPLILQIEREGQIFEIDITWRNDTTLEDAKHPTAAPNETWPMISPLDSPQPTPTPIPLPTQTPMPRDWLYF